MTTKTQSNNIYTVDSLIVCGYVGEYNQNLWYSFPHPIIYIIFEYYLIHWLEWDITPNIKLEQVDITCTANESFTISSKDYDKFYFEYQLI